MPYPPRQIPDAPISGSMLPPALTLHGTDIVVIVQTVNNPGEKTRSMTLSQLAAFIGSGCLDSITFAGANGYTTTVDGNGVKYHKDATVSDQAIRDYAINADGVHVSVITPNYTKKFESDGTKAVVTKTQQGLTDKVEVFENYIQITHQTRVNNQVVTQTSKFGWDELRARILRVMIDENNTIPLYWDDANGEFVVWDRTNNSKVGLPKVHVHGTLEVEKDATIRADVNITKTLTVSGRADFNGNFTVIKNLFATEHTELKSVSKLEMDMASGAIIKCSSTPNPTLPNDAAVGTRVIVLNDTENNHTVTFGLYTLTLNGHTAAEFLHSTSDTDYGWYKLT